MAQIARLKSAKPVKKTKQPARKAKPEKPVVTTPENN
jgi:hypothetical protein